MSDLQEKRLNSLPVSTKARGNDSFLTASRGTSQVGRAALRVGQPDDLHGQYDALADTGVIVEDVRVALLRTLVIAAQWRRQGLGSLLLAEACCIARRRGAAALYVHSVPLDGGGDPTGFYLKCGMEIVHSDSGGHPYLRIGL